MSTTIPSPPVPSEGNVGRPEEPRRGGASTAVAVVAIIVGSVVLVGTAGGAVLSTVRGAARGGEQTLSADAGGLTTLDVVVSEGEFTLAFDEVDDAVLEVSGADGSQGEWSLERDGATLRVASPTEWTGITWGWGDDTTEATLTLPERLRDVGLDAQLDLDAGALTAEGSFGDLGASIGAGRLTLDGAAETLDLEVNAGRGDVDLEDVSEASITVAAGAVDASLTGTPPRSVSVDSTAGSLDLRLPDGSYDVRSDVSAGSLDNRLDTSSAASSQVDVTVSAGRVALSSAD